MENEQASLYLPPEIVHHIMDYIKPEYTPYRVMSLTNKDSKDYIKQKMICSDNHYRWNIHYFSRETPTFKDSWSYWKTHFDKLSMSLNDLILYMDADTSNIHNIIRLRHKIELSDEYIEFIKTSLRVTNKENTIENIVDISNNPLDYYVSIRSFIEMIHS